MPKLRLKTVNMLQVSGDITYNGYHFNEFVVARTAAYVDQNSSHIAEMTVRETLDFAARVQGGGHGASLTCCTSPGYLSPACCSCATVTYYLACSSLRTGPDVTAHI